MEDALFSSADELRGFGVIAEACAEVLVNEPSDQVIDDVARVARALGDDRFDAIDLDDALKQRYYDRFFVPTSPFYVPLCESSVRGAAEEEGRTTYAPATGVQADHVLKCYHAVGFDFQAIAGFEPSVKSLKADSLASELAFLAFLARSAADAASSDPAAARRAEQLLLQFVREHAGAWFGKAARCLGATDDDLYARTAALAAEAVASLETA